MRIRFRQMFKCVSKRCGFRIRLKRVERNSRMAHECVYACNNIKTRKCFLVILLYFNIIVLYCSKYFVLILLNIQFCITSTPMFHCRILVGHSDDNGRFNAIATDICNIRLYTSGLTWLLLLSAPWHGSIPKEEDFVSVEILTFKNVFIRYKFNLIKH